VQIVAHAVARLTKRVVVFHGAVHRSAKHNYPLCEAPQALRSQQNLHITLIIKEEERNSHAHLLSSSHAQYYVKTTKVMFSL
jgi:hypothetical protein